MKKDYILDKINETVNGDKNTIQFYSNQKKLKYITPFVDQETYPAYNVDIKENVLTFNPRNAGNTVTSNDLKKLIESIPFNEIKVMFNNQELKGIYSTVDIFFFQLEEDTTI
ncbi:hypothetical protein LCIT_17180 [Leuconostoc citreum]|uniref:Uncharacterized protein n=1 Tax=Leuconostoc citreum TaxID=33964 RepID=A0A5A5U357_LEUCI|nr:hypothetical protein [Leuconostoc citreum]GDZ84476.1 hypothetical protein LCIT_17180 [Leuconostoc citreum]